MITVKLDVQIDTKDAENPDVRTSITKIGEESPAQGAGAKSLSESTDNPDFTIYLIDRSGDYYWTLKNGDTSSSPLVSELKKAVKDAEQMRREEMERLVREDRPASHKTKEQDPSLKRALILGTYFINLKAVKS